MIAHFVDCHDNFGDVLYPVVFEKVLYDLGIDEEIQRLSFIEGDAPLNAGYSVKSIQTFVNHGIPEAKVLIIGGGAILRSWQNKENYLGIIKKNKNPLPKLFWLKRYIYKMLNKNYFNKFFNKQYINFPSIGSYIINSNDLFNKVPIVFCSCGDIGSDSYPLKLRFKVKDAFENSNFIYLRDQTAKQNLLDCNVEKKLHVAPDLICLISDYYKVDYLAEQRRKLFDKYNISHTKKILVFQSYPHDNNVIDIVLKQLSECKTAYNAEILLLPLGYCHDDHLYLEKLSKISKGSFKFLPVDSIYDMIAIIGTCDYFIGTSMHGNITAFSYGKKFVIAPARRLKQQGFLKSVNLDSWIQAAEWDQLKETLDRINKVDNQYFDKRLTAAKNMTKECVKEMVNSMPINKNNGNI